MDGTALEHFHPNPNAKKYRPASPAAEERIWRHRCRPRHLPNSLFIASHFDYAIKKSHTISGRAFLYSLIPFLFPLYFLYRSFLQITCNDGLCLCHPITDFRSDFSIKLVATFNQTAAIKQQTGFRAGTVPFVVNYWFGYAECSNRDNKKMLV